VLAFWAYLLTTDASANFVALYNVHTDLIWCDLIKIGCRTFQWVHQPWSYLVLLIYDSDQWLQSLKIATLLTAASFNAFAQGENMSNFWTNLTCCYPCVTNDDYATLACNGLTLYQHVTDWWTDRQTCQWQPISWCYKRLPLFLLFSEIVTDEYDNDIHLSW